MQNMVIVYSGPGCMMCKLTHDWLAKRNIPHQVVDITQDDEARTWLAEKGLRTLPTVRLPGDEFFTGFNPPRLNTLIPAMAAA